MPANMQLFRDILTEADKRPFRVPADAHRFLDHDATTVMRHAEWLEEGGLLEADFLRSAQDPYPLDAVIHRVTWSGLEFLNNARNETVWQRTLKAVGAHGGTVSLSALKALLEQKAKEVFGIGGP